ncbi:MAG: hypothetical protein HY549_10205 [Elusimicrobia bacterium]|nr:hypothetical protein [Elusimicrobiota bacterium]
MPGQTFSWPAQRIDMVIKALELCIERLSPHAAKSAEVQCRRDDYVFLKELLTARVPDPDGSVRVTIDPAAAALIKAALLSYSAELKKS